MSKNIKYEKMSKKVQKEYNNKYRNTWSCNPRTRVVKDNHKQIRDNEKYRIDW